MRKYILCFVALLFFIPTSSPYAQLFQGIGIDTSLRVEYLFGRQTLEYKGNNNIISSSGSLLYTFRNSFDVRLPLLTGKIEINPYPSISGRLGGSISFFERVSQNANRIFPELDNQLGRGSWDQKQSYNSWEAAGLYHLWNAEGYRFSFTAGFRQDIYTYNYNISKDELITSIPFIGLQTSMFFPLWRARFELIGSPFMQRALLRTPDQLVQHTIEGKASAGGMLELQIEGSVAVMNNVWAGVNAAYYYNELYGSVDIIYGATRYDYDVYSGDSLFRVGFDVNIIF